MLISKEIVVKWNSKTKKHYESCGYIFTKMKDEFVVKVEDLLDGSQEVVLVECDYCHDKYTKHWCKYLKENKYSYIHKDSCSKCKKYKIMESNNNKYGVNSVLSLPGVQNKARETNRLLYGCDNPFQSEKIKQQICASNIQKYGFSSPMKNESIREKASKTCMKRYGVSNILDNYHKTGSLNHRWKGGVEYHRQERSTDEYIKWRKDVFDRDFYSCQCCNNRSTEGNPVILNAHHIYNWKDYPSKRYSVDNGITLCYDCHCLFHKIYGKSSNTELQLQIFLNNYGKKIC